MREGKREERKDVCVSMYENKKERKKERHCVLMVRVWDWKWRTNLYSAMGTI